MNRMDILKQIDIVFGSNCKGCSDRPDQNKELYSEKQHNCKLRCPVGAQLKELGKRLEASTRRRRVG